MINTYNESSLHKTLKILIAEEHASKTEVKLDGYICDVVTFYTSMKRGDFCDVFEIQTQNLGKLLSKITHLQKKHNVCLVHPISIETYIETYSENGEKLSCRKSPKKKDVYNLFDELTGIWSLINTCKNNKNSNVLGHFKLEIVETKIIKIKIKTKEPVQLTNKSRRWKRPWYIKDTKLKEIINRKVFKTAEDYLDLIPKELEKEFTVNDLANELVKIRYSKKVTKKSLRETHRIAGKMLWTYRKAGLVTIANKKGNAFVYKKTPSI